MIISHVYKYLFVEFPRTGSTAISRELCQSYNGERILSKHSTYLDFLKTASTNEKEYFTFSTIRNPLDDAVSHYFKLKTNHQDRYTQPKVRKKDKRLAERFDAYLYRLIQNENIDFETFFNKVYRFPYDNWTSMSIKHYDYVMRFENLQQDFDTVLRRIGITPVRPLPARNVTNERDKDFSHYYTPAIIPRAKRIFGPFMKHWGYEFPPGWGENNILWWNNLEYQFVTIFRRIYWSYFRPYI